MTEDVEKQEAIDSAAEPHGPLCGERLADARREQKIAVLEIAKELHLDEPKVRALERNDFGALGAPVFAKGHLRKYAELVDVDPDDVLADYYQLERAGEMPPLVSTRRRPRQELTPGPWIAVVVVLILVATAYWWFSSRALQPNLPPEVVTAPEVDERTIAEPDDADPGVIAEPEEADQETEPDPQPTDEEITGEDAPAEAPAEAPVEETSSPALAEGQMRVLLTYTGDCWTEITDASGRRLFFALGRDGRTVELTGVQPFNVLFGNPGNVTVLVNGSDYALPASGAPNRPLRLTLSGS
ncbi:MAG: DUF4115 domain-containing protein [Woeseiaceae bacterium]|nr:DUF4115 domain-containing protein [Woeseiaceae bacterium]